MANFNNAVSIGQLLQGAKDTNLSIKSNDAGDMANAISQILTGLVTAIQPTGDYIGWINLQAAAITALKIVRDYNDPEKQVDPLDFVAISSNLTSVAIAMGKNHPLLRGVNVVLGVAQVVLGSAFLSDAFGMPVDALGTPEASGSISSSVNNATTSALNWVPPRRDPLVLDLNGGGITTSAINPASPILFDQDGDGILTATGWIGAGEAIVVRDLNGNGTIDSGLELFGDNTTLTHGAKAGQKAANGFEAIADLDSNGDKKFDANDAEFSSVKLWQDLNQNGISEVNELFSFAQLGVQSINVTGTAGNVNLGGGNTQTFSGSFTKVGGAGGEAGTAQRHAHGGERVCRRATGRQR